MTFIDFIVDPLWETWAELVYPAGQVMMDNIAKTRDYWNAQIEPTSSDESSNEDSTNRCRFVPRNNGSVKVKEVAVLAADSNVTSAVPSAAHITEPFNSFAGSPVSDRRYTRY